MGRKKQNRAKKAAPQKEPTTIRVRPDSKTGFYHLDLRRWGEGRPLLRDPHAAPGEGAGTRDHDTALEWATIYAERRQQDAERRQKEEDEQEQKRTGKFRRLDLASEKYLDDLSLEAAESTVSASKSALTHLRGWVGDQADPSEIGSDHIKAMLKDLKDAEYKHKTLWNMRNRLCVFFDAIGVAPNPARAIKMKEGPNDDIIQWNDEERAAIRSAASEIDSERSAGDRLSRRMLAEYLLSSGARIQEAAAARWNDLDTDHGIVRIAQQVSRRSNTLRHTKGKAPRSVVILSEWWRFHDHKAKGFLFTDAEGRPIRYRKLYDVVREVLERAGLKKSGQCAHQFRHTYAYLFLVRGGSLDHLAKSLGHKDVGTTQKYYAHFSTEEAAKVASQIINKSRRRRSPRK